MDKFVKKEEKILTEISNNKRKGDVFDGYDGNSVKIKKNNEDHEYFTLNTGDKMPIGNIIFWFKIFPLEGLLSGFYNIENLKEL